MSEGPNKPQEMVWSGESDRETRAEHITGEFNDAPPPVPETAADQLDHAAPADWTPPPEIDDAAPVD